MGGAVDPRIDGESGSSSGSSGGSPSLTDAQRIAGNLGVDPYSGSLTAIATLLAQYPGAVQIGPTQWQVGSRVISLRRDENGAPFMFEHGADESKAILKAIAEGGDGSGTGGGGGGGSTARLASDDPRYWALQQAQLDQNQQQIDEERRQFDLSTQEGRRQFDLDYNRGIQTDAAKIGVDYAQLNQNERQFVQNLAYQYYNSFNDAETGRRQALASLIQARNNNITNLAQLQNDISTQWAQFAANPRDAFAEANYRAAVGGATPFGSTNNAAFGEYEQAAKDKVQQIFGPAGNMLQNAYQYATQPIPSEYLNPVQRPPELAAPQQILPPALNLPLAQYADNPNPTARALLSLRDLGVNQYSDAERAALTQIAGGQPQPVQPATKQFSAAEKAWINGVARGKGEKEPYPGFAKGGTVNVKPLGMASGGKISFADALKNVSGSNPGSPLQQLLAHAVVAGGINKVSAQDSPYAYGQYKPEYRNYDGTVPHLANTAAPSIGRRVAEGTATPNDMARAQAMNPNFGGMAPSRYGTGNAVTPVVSYGTPQAAAPAPLAALTPNALAPVNTASTNATTNVAQNTSTTQAGEMLPEHLKRQQATPFRIPGAAEGGKFNFDELWNSRTQPGQAPTDTEGGLNMNLNERAIILTESGQVVATLGERRPDGSIRREQLIVKPLKSEVNIDKKLEEQDKQAVESQKKTLAAFANGGTLATGQGGMESIRNLLRSLDPSLVPQQGQQLPDPRLLAPIYGRLQQDKDLMGLVSGAYSTQGISDNNLNYTLQQLQPVGIQGVPQVSWRG